MPRLRRRQVVQIGGGLPAYKTGAPSPFADPYYWVMELTWPGFIGIALAAYLSINLIFGFIFAVLPGSIADAT